MTQIWQQIRLGKHIGFEEGERARSIETSTVLSDPLMPWRSVAVDRIPTRVQAVLAQKWMPLGLISRVAYYAAVPYNSSVCVQCKRSTCI